MKRVIDFHAHAFPSKIATKAAVNLGKFYSFPVDNVATAEALEASARGEGVEKVVVHTTATAPMQVEAINNFIHGLKSDLFIPFGSIHPDYKNIEQEIDRMYEMGLRGLKLHPDFQEFDADAPKAIRIYKAIERLKMPLLIHGGDPTREFSRPQKIAAIKDYCPDLTVIVAHLGGYRRLEEADKYIIGKDFYIDTSSSLWYVSPSDAKSIIKKHGTKRVLFGTDYPVANHKEELQRFDALGLAEKECEDILYNNAAQLLGL